MLVSHLPSSPFSLKSATIVAGKSGHSKRPHLPIHDHQHIVPLGQPCTDIQEHEVSLGHP